jgi:predicted O-linked N-acetylglucosamine transferase (SPINDLY family)
LRDAVAHYDRALALNPEYVEAHVNLGNALKEEGKLDEAAVHYRRALELKLDDAKACNNLGMLLQAQGKLEEAVAQYQHALALEPNDAGAHNNLGVAFQAQGKLDEAVAQFQCAATLKQDYMEAHLNLGTALRGQEKLDAAVAQYQRALMSRPDHAVAHKYLGDALADQGKFDDAVTKYRRALSLRPDYADAHNNLGNAHKNQGKLEEALAAYQLALSLKPDNAETHNNLGTLLKDQGKLDEAQAQFQRALTLKPDLVAAYDNLLFCLICDERLSAAELYAAHKEWDTWYGQVMPPPKNYQNRQLAGRRLRIGYVSGDFRRHSVAWFFEPLLAAHDRGAMEIFCYAEVKSPDEVSERFKSLADHWRVTVGSSDAVVASQVAADGIDILVDLAGHSAGNRLGVFACKPAPVQATWLGYPSTTGLSAIDYRLVDAVTDPEDEAMPVDSENLVRLGAPFLCYGPPPDAPAPAPPPSLSDSNITFGSFNNPAKLSDATIAVWAELLSRVPGSCLLLKGLPFADASTRARYHDRFLRHGVPSERITLLGNIPDQAQHLALYRGIDIALDAFPYNGVTTTCEALWMGVPVVALRGHRHSGSVAASILASVGLDELIAADVEEYVDIAADLAHDRSRLTHLRSALRSRMAASPLCDASRFARNIEAAYRAMWRQRIGPEITDAERSFHCKADIE